MAKNYIEDGNTIPLTAGDTAISSGDLVLTGDMFAVALTDIDAGSTGTGLAAGVFALPKKKTDEISQGAVVYFDAAKITGTIPAANTDTKIHNRTPAGLAWADAPAGAEVVLVKINA